MFQGPALKNLRRPPFILFLAALASCGPSGQDAKEGPEGGKEKETEKKEGKGESSRKGNMENFNKAAFEEVFGKPIQKKSGFFKISFPRSDLDVGLEGVKLHPGFSHTTWMAFLPLEDGKARMMGDMVLLDQEIEKVLPILREEGIKVTAIHNHLAKERPPLKYMHVAAKGKPKAIAQSMRKAYQATALPLKEERGNEDAERSKWGKVEKIMGKEGKQKGKLLKFAFPRKGSIRMNGLELPPTFGVATAVNFQKVGKDSAVVTGDFVMTADEVNRVMRTLTAHGISSTALHNHMLHEKPRLFYMHFWGKDTPERLAKGLRAALDKGSYR